MRIGEDIIPGIPENVSLNLEYTLSLDISWCGSSFTVHRILKELPHQEWSKDRENIPGNQFYNQRLCILVLLGVSCRLMTIHTRTLIPGFVEVVSPAFQAQE